MDCAVFKQSKNRVNCLQRWQRNVSRIEKRALEKLRVELEKPINS